jgi:translation initiation factor 1 (eIF-1/SUI1)
MKNRYLHQPFFFLGLGALTAVGMIPVSSAQQAPGGATPAVAASLIEQLHDRGWQSTREPDGSTTLTPGPKPERELAPAEAVVTPQVSSTPAAASAAATTGGDGQASADSEPASGLGEQLKAKLTAAGWVTQSEADGSVTLTQPVDEAPPSDVPAVVEVVGEPAAPPAAEPPSLAADLKARLGAAGWVTQTEADGSVTLTQPVDEALPADVVEVAAVSDEPETVAAAEIPSLAADLKARLGAAGWVTRSEADGSVTLTQPVDETPPLDVPAVVEVAGKPAAPPAVEPPSLAADLKARLDAAGWVTRTEADGSVTLTQPVEEQSAELPTDAFVVCPGTSPRDNGDLPAAPIDTWAKARQVARAWRDQHLPGTVVVGLIREVPRLYIASLVSNDEGRELQHLLAIRKRNGEVFVID